MKRHRRQLHNAISRAVNSIASHFDLVKHRNLEFNAEVSDRSDIWRRFCALLTLAAVYKCAGWEPF